MKPVSFSTLNYTYKQTDKKGVVITFSGDFKLADIDAYTVREETQKDVIFVVVSKSNALAEAVFEFNLGDIFPGSVTYDVQGNFLAAKVETAFKDKIIKAYKAGKIAPYVYQLELAMTDTESARGIITALK